VLEIASEDDALLADHRGPYDGILSTHALLHGTRTEIVARLASLAARLAGGGYLFATFGSSADPRCGAGIYVAGDGWAATEGDEAGVTHAYFDRPALDRLLAGFADVRVASCNVAQVVGKWAHPSGVAHPSVHWFVEARRAHT